MPKPYTLEEAAQKLGVTSDELREMAKRGERGEKGMPRPLHGSKTLHFRANEIDELARQRGMKSDVDLPLGEAPASRPIDSPSPRKSEPEVFDFALPPADDDAVEIGQELLHDAPGSSKASRSGPKSSAGPKSTPPKSSPAVGRRKTSGLKVADAEKPPVSPPAARRKTSGLKAGSDSEVRIVPDDNDLGFQVTGDSDVKLNEDPASIDSPSSSKLPRPKPKSRLDSSVKIVQDTNSDSDVKIVEDSGDSEVALGGPKKKSASDSDIRVESASPTRKSKIRTDPRRAPDEGMLTEEIDLDAELESAEQQFPKKKKSQAKAAPPSLPTSSPFELSEADLDMPLTDEATLVGDSDLDLPTPPDSSSPLEEDEVSLGADLSPTNSDSGISLRDPADSGISLEEAGSSSDEIEFELSLDAGATPKPAKKESSSEFELTAAEEGEDSSPEDSEFELSLDDSGTGDDAVATADDSDSEFELSIDSDSDAELQPAEDSDSEFELTLDDSGDLGVQGEDSSEEKDIFETDFEVPALEEESGSEAVALDEGDTDLESSDFDLALDESDSAPEDESGSQVVALDDEEDVDEGAETVARKPAKRGGAVLEEDEDSGDVEDLFDMDDAESESEAESDEEEELAPARTAAPAQWGALPALVLLPSVVVLFIVTLMGYELVRSMQGYKQPSPLTRALVETFARGEMPKE